MLAVLLRDIAGSDSMLANAPNGFFYHRSAAGKTDVLALAEVALEGVDGPAPSSG